MKKFSSIIFAFLICNFALNVHAVDKITATVTITNATVNGLTFTVNGNVRTFTNNVVTPSTQVATNADVTGCGSKTNLFAQISLNLFAQVTPTDTGSNTFQLSAPCGAALVVSASGTYASITYSTNTCSAATPVGVPFTSYYPSSSVRSNMASQLEADIDSYSTNSKFLDLTKDQTSTGAKTFSSASGIWKGVVSNSPAINGTVVTLTGGIYNGPAITNGLDIWLDSEDAGVARIITSGSTLARTAEGFIQFAKGTDPTFRVDSGENNDFELRGDGDMTFQGNSYSFLDGVAINGNGAGLTNLSDLTAGNTNSLASRKEVIQIVSSRNPSNTTFTGTSTFPVGSDISFARNPVSSLANGANAAVPIGTNMFIEVSGPSAAFTINGIASGRDGKLIVILNQTGFDMTIAHQSGTDPTAANRIITMTGADRTTTGNGAATLIYSGAASRWLLISFDP